MKVLYTAIPTAELICSRQKEAADRTYRLTKHCVQADCMEGRLLFHTLTGEMILLENESDWDQFRSILIQKWFLVPTDFKETEFCDKVIRIAGQLHAGQKKQIGIKDFVILPTTDCNARCYYCYEAGQRKITMTDNTARDVADHVIRVSGGDKIQLHWFGGEPLYNAGIIDIICERLRSAEVCFKASMITNGYYLDEATIKKAVELWNLKTVQITLDGTANNYNRIKSYQEDGDAFSRVLHNIEMARAAGIIVTVRLNVSRSNVSDLMCLVDELSISFPKKDGLVVYPSLLGDFKKGAGRFVADNQNADSFLMLKEKIRSAGLEDDITPLQREISYNICKADNDASEVILPDGRLCRCDHELENDCYGSIYNDECDVNKIKEWKEQIRLPECYDCPLYPRCRSLKKCPSVNTHCSEEIQVIRIRELQHQIRKAYKKYKEGVE